MKPSLKHAAMAAGLASVLAGATTQEPVEKLQKVQNLGALVVAEPGFVSLFNGKDLSGWKVPKGDNGHWKVVDGVIDYDARSEAKGDKSLWSEKSFKDFILRVDWRFKTDEKGYMNKVPIILPDGSNKTDANGKEIRVEIEDVDSGIYLRGTPEAQVNIWMWPVGSGELWSVRNNRK